MPPEPHIEMNKSYVCPPSGQKYENQTYKVTVKNQSNNSQRINLLGPVVKIIYRGYRIRMQHNWAHSLWVIHNIYHNKAETYDGASIGTCSMNGDIGKFQGQFT